MNYYGTDRYKEQMAALDQQIFSKISLNEPDRVRELENGYRVKYYDHADAENRQPEYAPIDGSICRLFRNDEMVFEWKRANGLSQMAVIIHHSDGQDYFVFEEDLYGYSVLRLSDLACVHYLPAESYSRYPGEAEETFIWCDCYYNPENNLLAVDGCYWACPYSVIVLDFADPMRIVESAEWMDIQDRCYDECPDIGNVGFVRWDGTKLICKSDGAKPAGFIFDNRVEVLFE